MRSREEVSQAIATFQLALQQAYRMGDQAAFTTAELVIDTLRWLQGHNGAFSRLLTELKGIIDLEAIHANA